MAKAKLPPAPLRVFSANDTTAILDANGNEVVFWQGFDRSERTRAEHNLLARELVARYNVATGAQEHDEKAGSARMEAYREGYKHGMEDERSKWTGVAPDASGVNASVAPSKEPVAWAVRGADGKLLIAENKTLLSFFDNPPRPLVWGDADGVQAVQAPSQLVRALQEAEGRLMTLDNMNHPAIPRNDDVLATIRAALAHGVGGKTNA